MKSFLRYALWLSLAANLVGANASAFGQTAVSPHAAEGKGSPIATRCKNDAAKLCPRVAPGGGRLAACLGSHETELSAPCKAALPAECLVTSNGAAPAPPARSATGAKAYGALPPAAAPQTPSAGNDGGRMRRACAADVQKFCKDVPQGRGRIAFCLNEHSNELSAGCKPAAQVIATQMAARKQMHSDCAADVQKLCADMPAGPGRTGFCLGEHAAELSVACKKHIDRMKTHAATGVKGG